jgi:hypothetical protein
MRKNIRRPLSSSVRASLLGTVAVLFIAALACLAVVGCGSSSDGSEASDSGSTQEAGSPKELGEQIVVVYDEGMEEVVALMADRPDVATLQPQVEKLKEESVQKLVELGKQREALDDSDRAAVDAVILEGLSTLPPELFEQFTEDHAYYLGQDVELGNLIASFNTITQYASFDLLRSQEPDEAERLGI